MKKIYLVIFFIFVCFQLLFLNTFADKKVPELKDDDFKIYGLNLGQPVSESLLILGKPIKIEYGDRNSELDKYYYFSQIMITTSWTYPNKVSYILIRKKGIKSFRGIQIGDSAQKVLAKYGKKELQNSSYFFEKPFDNLNNCGLDFIMEKGVVKEIAIYYVSLND